jgi:hypothetical protein
VIALVWPTFGGNASIHLSNLGVNGAQCKYFVTSVVRRHDGVVPSCLNPKNERDKIESEDIARKRLLIWHRRVLFARPIGSITSNLGVLDRRNYMVWTVIGKCGVWTGHRSKLTAS